MLAASILGFIDRDRPNIPLQSFLKGALSTSHTRCCFLGMPTIQEWQCPSYRYPLLCFNILTEYLKNLAFFNSFVEDEFNIICQYLEHLEHIFPWFSMPCLPTPTSGPPQTPQASKPGLRPLRCMAWSRQAAFSKRRCWELSSFRAVNTWGQLRLKLWGNGVIWPAEKWGFHKQNLGFWLEIGAFYKEHLISATKNWACDQLTMESSPQVEIASLPRTQQFICATLSQGVEIRTKVQVFLENSRSSKRILLRRSEYIVSLCSFFSHFVGKHLGNW